MLRYSDYLEYDYKDYKGIKVEANNKEIRKLAAKIDKLNSKKRDIRYYDMGADRKKHRINVLINLYTQEIAYLNRNSAAVQNQSRDEVLQDSHILSNIELDLRNKSYEKRAEEIRNSEAALAAQRERINRMSDGKIKNKAITEANNLEIRINHLKGKNVRSERKQVAILVRKERLNKFVTRKKMNDLRTRREINKLVAKRDVYLQERSDAQSAQRMAGISQKDKMKYAKSSVKLNKKIKKINKRLNSIRQKRVVALGGNQRTIPTRQPRTQAPTR